MGESGCEIEKGSRGGMLVEGTSPKLEIQAWSSGRGSGLEIEIWGWGRLGGFVD